MDYNAAERMENFAKQILNCSTYVQSKIWEGLKSVLTENEINGLKEYVGLFHMFTDQNYYDSVRKAVGEEIYKEFHKQ